MPSLAVGRDAFVAVAAVVAEADAHATAGVTARVYRGDGVRRIAGQ